MPAKSHLEAYVSKQDFPNLGQIWAHGPWLVLAGWLAELARVAGWPGWLNYRK